MNHQCSSSGVSPAVFFQEQCLREGSRLNNDVPRRQPAAACMEECSYGGALSAERDERCQPAAQEHCPTPRAREFLNAAGRILGNLNGLVDRWERSLNTRREQKRWRETCIISGPTPCCCQPSPRYLDAAAAVGRGSSQDSEMEIYLNKQILQPFPHDKCCSCDTYSSS